MREWRVGDRVSSIATSYPGVGTIINVRFGDIEVRWPDGSWSRERPQDLIYGGRPEDPVTPLGANIVEPTFNQGWGRILPFFNSEGYLDGKPLNPESNTRMDYRTNTIEGVINPTVEVLPQSWGSGSLEVLLTPERTAIVTENKVPNSLVENFPIYEEMCFQSRQPGAAIPMIAKGVVF